MFARLKLKLDSFSRLKIYSKEKQYLAYGSKLCEELNFSFRKTVSSIINSSLPLDSSELENAWFPSVSCDIFLSHSHKDEELAIKLAGLLKEEFGLNCFVDSAVWKHEDDLFYLLEKKYNFDKDGDPLDDKNISKQNREYCVLLTNCALMKMIDKCDCMLFLETNNSTPVQNITYSPWINSEILISNLVRTPIKVTAHDSFGLKESTRPLFKLDFKRFITVCLEDFEKAKKKCGKTDSVTFLKTLYRIIEENNSKQGENV